MTVAPPLQQRTARYRTALATTSSEIEAAQRLRHEIFALECGAALDPVGAATGRDVDEWDEHCDHLVVREEVSDRVVGTYRLLRPERAAGLGRSYGDGEFDLSRLTGLRPGLVEAGRSCVHPDHRTGAVITQLWAGVARYVVDGGHTHLGGCASVPLADGGATAAGLWDLLVRERRLAPAGLWVLPHVPFDVHAPARPDRLVLPPLIRAYLRIGARVCGRPAHDAAFGTADFYVLLAVSDIHPRVLRRLLGGVR
ncbi:GNAT family N-acetyltransferase [Blastococcus mobilis]|uniref:Ornithine-acyl[acyl carrier protein] N-acyltransferase n=1 Tax=Blastococcus mobilis TaxID=1938746 RepID=A0A239A1E1_9ACTN|nr:GNAT family N-acyltransferase [Blastococcus mobilis]SNR89506.1 ornithine-acyl[acyl carrier protein] N-acyltransferase [Blastococcus mobilis]